PLRFGELGFQIAREKFRDIAAAQVDRAEHAQNAVLDDTNRGFFVADIDKTNALPWFDVEITRKVIERQAVDIDQLGIDLDALQVFEKTLQEVLARHHHQRDGLAAHAAENLVVDDHVVEVERHG